jgi:hypothetical protein
MDGLEQLRSQQATEWHYYPNMMFRIVCCERKKKMFPFYFALSLNMARPGIIGTMFLYKWAMALIRK